MDQANSAVVDVVDVVEVSRAAGPPAGSGVGRMRRSGDGEAGGLSSPGGITGDGLTVVARHDWLNVTAASSVRDELRELVTRYLGPGQFRDRGANTYAESFGWESGCILAWTDGRRECWLSMNGDSCDLIPPELKLAFVQELRRLGCKCTRLDVALDVPRSLASMELVHEAAEAGQVVGFKRYVPVRPVRDMSTGELEGDQANFGRRGRDGSGRYVRVYDKGLESRGVIDCIRFEAELAGELADQVFGVLCMCQDHAEFDKYVGRFASSSIDFADKSASHGHKDRFERLPWWSRIVELVGSARVAVSRVRPALERSVEFVRRAVAVILARVERVVDRAGMAGRQVVHQLVDDVLSSGRRRLAFRPGAWSADDRVDVEFFLSPASCVT